MGRTVGATVRRAWTELRVSARTLARRPVFSGVVVGTLAASLGAATLLFSVLEGVLLRPLPYEDPGELVRVYATNEEWRSADNAMLRNSWDSYGVSFAQLEAWRASGALEILAGSRGDRMTLREGERAEPILIERVGRGVFEVLGVEPRIGRLPSAGEYRDGEPVVLLSDRLWTERFGADPDVLGRSVTLQGNPFTVIGVLPAGFRYPHEGVRAWTLLEPSVRSEDRDVAFLRVVGRLPAGVSHDDVRPVLAEASRALAASDPAYESIGVRPVSLVEEVVGDVRKGLLLLVGTTAAVLLLACLNLGNLLLARSVRRRSELAVRASLGAGAGTLLWSIATEVVLLCGLGGLLGVLAAVGLLEPFLGALEASISTFPRTAEIEVNLLVLGFGVAATALTAGLAALPVAQDLVRGSPADTLRHGGRSGGGGSVRKLQRILLVVETGLAVVLLSGAALQFRSFDATLAVDAGYDAEGLVYAQLTPGSDRYPGSAELADFYRRLAGRVASIPGVERITEAGGVPSTGPSLLDELRTDEGEESAMVAYGMVGAEYFETVGTAVRAGRGFDSDDGPAAVDVAVVNESLARRIAPDGRVVGRRVTLGEGEGAAELEIVGVVGDARMHNIRSEPGPYLFRPMAQRPTRSRALLLRSERDPETLLEAVRAAIAEVDPGVRVEEVGTVRGAVADTLSHLRFRVILMGALAGLALLLALVGVFGVVAQIVEEQTREIGIRMALGSGRGGEVRRVLQGVVVPAVAGAILGIAVAWQASDLAEGFVRSDVLSDPRVYAAAAILLVLTAVLAAWLPARRAAGVDPARVLDRE